MAASSEFQECSNPESDAGIFYLHAHGRTAHVGKCSMAGAKNCESRTAQAPLPFQNKQSS